MKLRNREPSSTVRDAGPARGDDGELSAPTPRSRPSRRASIAVSAPRASRATPRPTPRSAPRTAPRGGVQKRKVSRPAIRQRSDTTTTTTTARARRVAAVAAAADHLVQAKTRSQARAAIREPVVKEGMEEDVVDAEEVADDKPKTTIDDLPEEVMLGIFSYFRPPQLCWKIGRVCRRWASWSVSSILWKDKEYTLSPDPNLSSKKT